MVPSEHNDTKKKENCFMSVKRRFIYILTGPVILVLTTLLLSDILTTAGAQAVGTLFWMIFWWVTLPVHMTITALVPVIVNACLNVVPMGGIISQYASDSIVLIFGSGLLSMTWATTGLDRRAALKILSVIGPSMKSQITVWLLTSMIVSSVLPNVAVCALFTPIAVSMLAAAGYRDISSAAPAVPILLCIGWGVGIGGVGTPLGGAMNIAAISYFEAHTGHEFMYIDWIVRMAPYFVILTASSLAFMLLMPSKVKNLEGTKEYFTESYREIGPMKRDEKICASLFILALLGVFLRPLYAHILPGLAPAYIFLVLGSLAFFIATSEEGFMLTWDKAEKGTLWGMMVLFGGGLALGRMINDSGASNAIADVVSNLSFDGGFLTIAAFAVLARLISEFTNSTVSAAVTIPIVLGFTSKLGLNPVPYWFITVMAFNSEFVLPISVRAIPVGYGLDPAKLFKSGIMMTIFNLSLVLIAGYLMMKFWPAFSTLPYL